MTHHPNLRVCLLFVLILLTQFSPRVAFGGCGGRDSQLPLELAPHAGLVNFNPVTQDFSFNFQDYPEWEEEGTYIVNYNGSENKEREASGKAGDAIYIYRFLLCIIYNVDCQCTHGALGASRDFQNRACIYQKDEAAACKVQECDAYTTCEPHLEKLDISAGKYGDLFEKIVIPLLCHILQCINPIVECIKPIFLWNPLCYLDHLFSHQCDEGGQCCSVDGTERGFPKCKHASKESLCPFIKDKKRGFCESNCDGICSAPPTS